MGRSKRKAETHECTNNGYLTNPAHEEGAGLASQGLHVKAGTKAAYITRCYGSIRELRPQARAPQTFTGDARYTGR
jgi:hypothetical protein